MKTIRIKFKLKVMRALNHHVKTVESVLNRVSMDLHVNVYQDGRVILVKFVRNIEIYQNFQILNIFH